jgi:hypothetical protein
VLHRRIGPSGGTEKRWRLCRSTRLEDAGSCTLSQLYPCKMLSISCCPRGGCLEARTALLTCEVARSQALRPVCAGLWVLLVSAGFSCGSSLNAILPSQHSSPSTGHQSGRLARDRGPLPLVERLADLLAGRSRRTHMFYFCTPVPGESLFWQGLHRQGGNLPPGSNATANGRFCRSARAAGRPRPKGLDSVRRLE